MARANKRVTRFELLAQLRYQAEVAKRLDTAHHLAVPIAEDPGGNADRYRLAARVQDVDRLVDDRQSGLEGLPQGTRAFANAGPKHLATGTPNRLLPRHPRDLLRRSIERRHQPLLVDRENAIGDRVEDDLVEGITG
jgi:hypothetical protein